MMFVVINNALYVCLLCIDICWSGSFKSKKTKKNRVSSITLPCAVAMTHSKVTIWAGLGNYFAVCHIAGTRRSDHTSPCAWGWHMVKAPTRRGPQPCLPCVGPQGTRQNLNLRCVPCALAHGEHPPTPSTEPSTEPHVVCSL